MDMERVRLRFDFVENLKIRVVAPLDGGGALGSADAKFTGEFGTRHGPGPSGALKSSKLAQCERQERQRSISSNVEAR